MARNRYVARAHLSEARFRRLVRLFALDLEATKVAALTGLSRRTVNRYFQALRVRMAQEAERQAASEGPPLPTPPAPVGRPDPRPSRTGRAVGRATVFGIVVRQGQVRTEMVRNGRPAGMLVNTPDTASEAEPGAWLRYDAVVMLRARRQTRMVRCRAAAEAPGRVRIDRVESFWSATKTRLAKRRGVHRQYFYLHLKECEFRFNHREADLYHMLLDLVRREPIK
jgi:transposase